MNALLPKKCGDGKTFLKIIKMLLQISLCWKEKTSEISELEQKLPVCNGTKKIEGEHGGCLHWGGAS